MTDMPLADIKHYIDLCVKGDETIAERYEIIKKQSGIASKELDIMQERVKMLEKKVDYYKALLDGTEGEDYWNPIYLKLMRCLAD
jgi:DNA-binding transcriptional MerR regulator